MSIRIALFAGLAVVALSGSAYAGCYPDRCPPPKCVGVKCYVIDPVPTEVKGPTCRLFCNYKGDGSGYPAGPSAQPRLTPSIPIPPPETRR